MPTQSASMRYQHRSLPGLIPALCLLAFSASTFSGLPLKAQPAPLPSLPAPQHLGSSSGDGTITLKWSPVAGADAYRVSYSLGSEGPFIKAADVNSTHYAVLGVTNWVPHYYRVAAVRSKQTGMSSQTLEATPTGPLAAPLGLHPYRGHTQASLLWKSVPGADGYTVYRSIGSDPAAPSVPVATGVVPCVWTDSGLTDGVVYRYRVAARISAARMATLSAHSPHPAALLSPASPAASVTPLAGLPLAPASLSATVGNRAVTLVWPGTVRLAASVPEAVTYRVYQGERSGGEAPKPMRAGMKAASLTSEGLTNGTRYFYLVTSVNAVGESAFSIEQSAMPQAPGTALAMNPANVGGLSTGNSSPNVLSLAGGPAPSAAASGGTNSGSSSASTGAGKVASTTIAGTGPMPPTASPIPSPGPTPSPTPTPSPVQPAPTGTSPAPVGSPVYSSGPLPEPTAPTAPVPDPTPVSSPTPVGGGGDVSPKYPRISNLGFSSVTW